FGRNSLRADRLPDDLTRWVRHQNEVLQTIDDVPQPRLPMVVSRHDRELRLRLFSGSTQHLLLLEERVRARSPAQLTSLGLTRRESEVLLWVAQGKTNEAIAVIVGARPRTVEKHL